MLCDFSLSLNTYISQKKKNYFQQIKHLLNLLLSVSISEGHPSFIAGGGYGTMGGGPWYGAAAAAAGTGGTPAAGAGALAGLPGLASAGQHSLHHGALPPGTVSDLSGKDMNHHTSSLHLHCSPDHSPDKSGQPNELSPCLALQLGRNNSNSAGSEATAEYRFVCS